LVDNDASGHVSNGQKDDPTLKLKTKAVMYGVAGFALSGAIIFSGLALGLLNTRSSGILAVLLTDPPSVPRGVTAVYITYSDISVHAAGFGDSGWVSIPGQGTIDTLKLVNLSQTITSGAIPSLTYNKVAFSISGATVVYMGKNYSATAGSGKLVITIPGGLMVSSSSPAAALIDIQPTVVNLGSRSNPTFTIATGARALQVPSQDVDQSTNVVGHQSSLQGHSWYSSFKEKHSSDLNVSGLSLTPHSFSFSVTNSGSDPITIRMVIVSAGSIGGGENSALASVANGAVFTVQADGSLKLLNGAPGATAVPSFQNTGYSLAGGATQQFTFSGAITNLFGNQGVVSGMNYSVLVVGSGTLSVQTIAAS
jgi:hypothetical protein